MTPETATPRVAPMLLTPREAAAACKISLRQWQRLASAGRTPEPIRFGARCLRYVPAEIEAWIGAHCRARVEHRHARGTRKS